MTADEMLPRYSSGEEIASSVTHGIGALLAVAGLVVLSVAAGRTGAVRQVVGAAVFGTSLVLLYTASTLYHSIRRPRAKSVLRVLDHCAIFVLIAGTATPLTLVTLQGAWGWSIFGVVWSLAVLGIVIQITPIRHRSAVSIALYLVMGWLIIVALRPLLAAMARPGFYLLLAGGLVYTGGVIVYACRRLPYQHAIWHLFVLTGSTLHFLAVLLYVIQPVA